MILKARLVCVKQGENEILCCFINRFTVEKVKMVGCTNDVAMVASITKINKNSLFWHLKKKQK